MSTAFGVGGAPTAPSIGGGGAPAPVMGADIMVDVPQALQAVGAGAQQVARGAQQVGAGAAQTGAAQTGAQHDVVAGAQQP